MFAPILLLSIVGVSILLRADLKKRQESAAFPEHAKDSPISLALQELIATAGGIYLSLLLLISFLHIEVTDHWRLFDIEFEPLAFTALFLSVLQPYLLKIYILIKRG